MIDSLLTVQEDNHVSLFQIGFLFLDKPDAAGCFFGVWPEWDNAGGARRSLARQSGNRGLNLVSMGSLHLRVDWIGGSTAPAKLLLLR